MESTKWRGAFMDPRKPDAFERGAVLPALVEQRAVQPLLAGGLAAALMVLRAAVLLLAADLVITFVRLAIQNAPPDKLFSPVHGFLSLYARIEEVAWLEASAPSWLATTVFVASCLIGAWLAFSFADLLGATTDAIGTTGSTLGRFADLAKSSFVDRAIAVAGHPIGRGREGLWRVVVLVGGFVLGALLLDKLPPSQLVAIVRVEDSFPLVGNFVAYALLAGGYLLSAFMAIQAAWQIAALVSLWRASPHRQVTAWSRRASTGLATLDVLHWSDLHVTPFEDSLRTDKKNIGGNRALGQLVERALDSSSKRGAIVITGDTTDAGRSAEWARFLSIAEPVLDRIVLVPGNHDLNIIDPLRWSIVGDDAGIGRALREIRMLAALDAVQGNRAFIWVEDSGVITLREYLAAHANFLHSFYHSPKPGHLAAIKACFRNCFPMSVVVNEEFVVDVFDSNDVASNVITNAFGRVEQAAIGRYKHLVTHFANRGHMVALHHHLAYPRDIHEKGFIDHAMSRFLVVLNAREFAYALEPLGRTVVLHGHRHIGYEGQIGTTIEIMSARSSTLGDSRVPSSDVGYQRLLVERDGASGTHVAEVTSWSPSPRALPASERPKDAEEEVEERA